MLEFIRMLDFVRASKRWQKRGKELLRGGYTNITRIVNAVQCHSFLWGLYDCHNLSFSRKSSQVAIVKIVKHCRSCFASLWPNVLNVTSQQGHSISKVPYMSEWLSDNVTHWVVLDRQQRGHLSTHLSTPWIDGGFYICVSCEIANHRYFHPSADNSCKRHMFTNLRAWSEGYMCPLHWIRPSPGPPARVQRLFPVWNQQSWAVLNRTSNRGYSQK